MCHVPAGDGTGNGAGSGGSLVAVSSAGGVIVWRVPNLKGSKEKGFKVPLLATYSVKVTDTVIFAMAPLKIWWLCKHYRSSFCVCSIFCIYVGARIQQTITVLSLCHAVPIQPASELYRWKGGCGGRASKPPFDDTAASYSSCIDTGYCLPLK